MQRLLGLFFIQALHEVVHLGVGEAGPARDNEPCRGSDQIAIDAIKAGKWDATLAQLPMSEGEYALNGVVDALEGKPTPAFTDEMKLGGDMPAIITKKALDEHPDYKPEWQG